MQNSVISTWNTSLYGSQPSSVVFACKTATFNLEYKSLWVPDLTCRFVYAKQRDLHKNKMTIRVPALTCGFVHAKQRLWNRITNLYGSQTSPVDLCRQYSVISTRNTCLYGSQSLSVIFACKTATSGLELQVSVGPRLHLWFSACKTACLASELLVSMGPSPYVWFLDAKQRLLDRKYKSLWVPHLTCPFVHAK